MLTKTSKFIDVASCCSGRVRAILRPCAFFQAVAIVLLAGVLEVTAADVPKALANDKLDRRKDDDVSLQLEQKVSLTWSGVPLRQAIATLARSQRVAIVLDRRVDPDQKIDFMAEDRPLGIVLQAIAVRLKLGMSRVGPVVYLGPVEIAANLRTVAELCKDEAARLPAAARSKLLVSKAVAWELLTQPRQIVVDLAKQSGVKIAGSEKVPHDLWAAGELPAMPLLDRVTILAAQFNLSVEVVDDGSLRIVDFPTTAVIERSYPTTGQDLSKLKKMLVKSELRQAGAKLQMRGPAEEHDLVRAALAGKTAKRSTVIEGKKAYTLTIVMSVSRLLKELAPKLELEVQIDEPAIKAAGLSLDHEVKVNVKEASREQLLQAVLSPAGLIGEVSGKTLIVKPK